MVTIKGVHEHMNAAYYLSQIRYHENKLNSFQNDLAAHEEALASMKRGSLYFALIIIFLVVFFCSGCAQSNMQTIQNNYRDEKPLDENILVEEDNSMSNEPLLTEVELLEFIEMNDTGLSKDDFADVNIDEFIEHTRLSMSRLATANIKNRLELFKSTLKSREFDIFKANEVFIVDSSDDEYESFKSTFFDRIGTDIQYIGKTTNNIDMFYVTTSDARVRIHIGQTRNIDKNDLITSTQGTLSIIARGSSDTYSNSPFCYSKNRKYFMILNPSMEVMEAFCEIND
jgi:hypothetical protein